MPPAEKELLSEHAVRVYRRQRWLGESNFVVMADPSKPGGEKLPIVSIIRMSKGPCCGTSMRRTCLDARSAPVLYSPSGIVLSDTQQTVLTNLE